MKSRSKALTEAEKGEFIMMALSDHVSFDLIALTFGMSPDDIKRRMKSYLAPGSYRAWRKRVRAFSDQRLRYK